MTAHTSTSHHSMQLPLGAAAPLHSTHTEHSTDAACTATDIHDSSSCSTAELLHVTTASLHSHTLDCQSCNIEHILVAVAVAHLIPGLTHIVISSVDVVSAETLCRVGHIPYSNATSSL
jgi:hypothetical protein